GLLRTLKIPGVLPAHWLARHGHACSGESALGGACAWCERRDRRSAGSLFRFVSQSAGADLVLYICAVGASVDHPGILVCLELSQRNGHGAVGTRAKHGWRGLLGARGRICLGGATREGLWRTGNKVS